MADDWLGVSSANIDSHCGDDTGSTLAGALNGTQRWYHSVAEIHWFILDLGESYTIKKVKGRSARSSDPTNVDIYVSASKDDWGDPVATGISSFANTNDFSEESTTEKTGRYVKVVINETEAGSPGNLTWGGFAPYTIFDVYGSVAAGGQTFYETPSDSLSIDDNLVHAATFRKTPADNFAMADGLEYLGRLSTKDVLSIEDGLQYKKKLSIEELLSISDALQHKKKISLEDSLSVGDGLAKNVGIPRAELLGIIDFLTKSFKASLVDTISINDQISTSIPQVSLSDTLSISDLKSLSFKIARGDQLSIADQTLLARVIYCSDVMSITDSLVHQFVVFGGLTDLTQTPALVVTRCFAVGDDVPKSEKLRIWARSKNGKETVIYIDPAS